MPVNTTHAEYDANLTAWTRARRVMAGEDAVKAAGEAFLPRLELQTDAEYAAYKARASFFNATSRTADGFVGLIFRRSPFIRLPDLKTGVGLALQRFENDVDLSGTTLGSDRCIPRRWAWAPRNSWRPSTPGRPGRSAATRSWICSGAAKSCRRCGPTRRKPN